MNAFFEALCRASIFGLAALFVALCAQYLLSRVPSAWRAWIWRIALLQSAFALLPLSPVRWQVLAPPRDAAAPKVTSAPRVQSKNPVADNVDLPPLDSKAPGKSAPLVSKATSIESAPPVSNAAPIESAPLVPLAKAAPAPFDWRALALAIYALGIAFQFAQLMRGKRQLRHILRNCAPAEDALLNARLNVLAARLSLKAAPQLRISEGGSPFLTGVWRPQLVLPRALCRAELSQLDAILAHELAHLKRRDLVWLGAAWLLQTLLWFHPLSWVSRRFHGLETECACDELALQLAPIAPQSYGALLLNSMNNSKFSSPLAAGTCDTLFALKTRLLRLNNAPKSPRKLAKLAFALALLVSCGAVVPLKLVARAGDSPIVAPTDKMQAPPKSQLAGSAVVQGVVTSKQTGRPLAGVSMILTPSSSTRVFAKEVSMYSDQSGKLRVNVEGTFPDLKSRQEIATDARGYFRFNAGKGDYMLLVDGNISVGATKRINFSAQEARLLKVKDEQKQEFKFELDETLKKPDKTRIPTKLPATRGTGNAVLQGVIVSKQTQKPLAGVPIIVTAGNARMTPKQGALAKTSMSQKTVTDARGYFRFNVAGGVHSLLIDAKILAAPGKTTFVDPRRMTVFVAQQVHVVTLGKTEMRNFRFELDETRATSDKAATSPARNPTSASASGRVVDENKRPLAGVTVTIYQHSSRPKSVKSDVNGRFRFTGLKSDVRTFTSLSLSGYGGATVSRSKNGNDTIFNATMPRASATLRGIVIGEDGQPARNFLVEPSAYTQYVKTDAQGRFFLPQVVPSATNIRVLTPNGGNGWGPINVRGGDQNVKIRLTHSISDARFPVISAGPATSANSSDKTRALIGKIAPEIQAFRWANGKAAPLSSLRGKVVLLAFQDFTSGEKKELSNFARDFAATARVVGIQINTGRFELSQPNIDTAATRLGFPIAIDAPRLAIPMELAASLFARMVLALREFTVTPSSGAMA